MLEFLDKLAQLERRIDRYLPAETSRQSDEPAEPEWWDGVADPCDADAFLAAYDSLDEVLIAKGFPPTSPWWRERLEQFFRSGRKTSIWRVGRRGGKSSTMCRVLVALALFAKWKITPGDIGVISLVSVDSGEATSRLTMIRAILDALGTVPFAPYSDPTSNGWKFLDRPIQFRVKSCSISGTSGFTAIAVLADEMSKWRSPADGKNPSKEILTSLRATTLTVPGSKIFAVSSAFSTTDHHAKMIDDGDSEELDQVTFIGATWESNPSPEATEEATRKLEPDKAKWLREFGSIPSDAGENPWFVTDDVDNVDESVASIPVPNFGSGTSYACIDTGFKRNASGLVILRWDDNRITTAEVLKLVPEKGKPLKPSAVFAKFAERLRAHKVRSVAADQHYIEAAKEGLEEFNVVELPGGPTGKADVYTRARDAMREHNVDIPSSAKDLIRQLKQVSYKLTTGGSIQIVSPVINGQHGDEASAFAGAVWLAIERGPGSRVAAPPPVYSTPFDDQYLGL